MSSVKPLALERLHATFDPARLEWDDSAQISLPKNGKAVQSQFQPRAMKALELALSIKSKGYNVFLCGEADLGRTYTLLSCLKPRAARMDIPPDLVYVYNFADPDSPSLIQLPAGLGQKLKSAIKELIEKIGPELEKLLDSAACRRERAQLLENFNSNRADILSSMHSLARENGFTLDFDADGGIALSPDLEDDKKNRAESVILDMGAPLKKRARAVARDLLGRARDLNKIEEACRLKESSLVRKAMSEVLNRLFPAFEKKFFQKYENPRLSAYLSALKNDILDNCDSFIHQADLAKNEDSRPPQPDFSRYAINIFVDNGAAAGAPVIVEDNPTVSNLLGRMERESELGTLVTDFTLIRSGSLQKANGGFLVLHIDDLLQRPPAWDAFLRALRSSQAKIEENGELPDLAMRTKSLSPEPLALDLKVILIGGEDALEDLLDYDERFAKLFRIKAHMNNQAARNAANVKLYLTQIAQIIHEEGLLPFDRGALAWLVDLGSHLCEDQKRISLKFPLIRSVMIEACALAKNQGAARVSGEILEEAYAGRDFRENLVEEMFMEDYDRQMIKVETSGSAVGQVNGLSVSMSGDFEFGLPHRISCTVGVGHDGIIDLERESDLGGPIHTKAMLILKGYLTKMFARKKPLVLNASLYFEQSYAGVEGDSASGAELAALLSALADVPVRLDLAFTGALGNSGQIMAVGGVTRKIEGFYKVCSRKGLTGTQGVIIPNDNVDHLMLSPEVLDSVRDNRFFIYAVRNIEEALGLLTGMPAGKARKDGSFTKGSLFDLVDRRLERLGCYAQNAFRRPRKD